MLTGARYFLTGTLVLLALISDIKTFKIKNVFVFPFAGAGIAVNTIADGLSGFVFSLKGFFIPIMLLIIFFALRMLGAGDIKLFGAIGAIMGLNFTLYTMAYSFLAGGIIAFIILVINKNGRQRLIYLLNYIKSCVLTFSLLPYEDFKQKNNEGKFRFAYAAACGVLIHTLFETVYI